jgi:hypothetical protein
MKIALDPYPSMLRHLHMAEMGPDGRQPRLGVIELSTREAFMRYRGG